MFFACVLIAVIRPAPSVAQLSVDDVIAGIKARESEVRDFEMTARLKSEITAEYAKYIVKRRQSQSAGSESVKKEAADATKTKSVKSESDDGIQRVSIVDFQLASKGTSQWAYEVTSDSETLPRQHGVFDGELWKAVMPGKSRGSVGVKSSPDDFLPFTRPEELFFVEGMDIVDYLQRNDIRVSTPSLVSVDGESLVKIDCLRIENITPPKNVPKGTVLPAAHRKIEMHFDPLRGFWPKRVKEFQILKNLPNQNGDVVELLTDVEIQGFHESGGLNYPKTISRRQYQRWKSVDKDDLARAHVMTVSDVKINSDLPHERFAFAFPSGTTYNDERDQRTYLVDPDGTIKDMMKYVGKTISLPTSKYTKEEAAEILGSPADYTPMSQSMFGGRRAFLIGANVVLFVAVLSILRRRRVRQSLLKGQHA